MAFLDEVWNYKYCFMSFSHKNCFSYERTNYHNGIEPDQLSVMVLSVCIRSFELAIPTLDRKCKSITRCTQNALGIANEIYFDCPKKKTREERKKMLWLPPKSNGYFSSHLGAVSR